ncbi:sulfatase [Puteibacter caeruleilacunae]|nr:sulfatase [Puteibacter caeruleilacunae]
MKRINALKVGLGIAGVLGLYHGDALAKEPKKSKPNILFLFTDDHRFSSVNELGESEIITPNIDKLADSGVTFTNTHIMGSMSGAVCMPSRAMLMTGKYVFNLNEDGKHLPASHVTMPETLKKNGYNTFHTGKWHNNREGFVRSFTHGDKIFLGGMCNHAEVPVHDFDSTGKYTKADRYIGKKFSSELFADAAINFIDNYKEDKPFFMFVSFTAPHDPRMAPEKYVKMYDKDKISLPKNYMPKHPFDNGEIIIRDELLAPFPRTEDVVKEEIIAYYAMITQVDEQIGRIMKTLEAKGQADNTIIIFAGDNGLAVGQHGLMGKQNVYDHSVRVPLIFAGPGIDKGVKNDVLCLLSDVFPTVCDLTDIKIPESIETHSLMKNIQNEKLKSGPYEDLYFAYKNFQRGYVNQDGWKMIRYNVEGKETIQLFNLKKDPYELKNLSGEKKYENREREMLTAMQKWAIKSGDKVNFAEKNWNVPVIESWVTNRKRRGLPIDASAANAH